MAKEHQFDWLGNRFTLRLDRERGFVLKAHDDAVLQPGVAREYALPQVAGHEMLCLAEENEWFRARIADLEATADRQAELAARGAAPFVAYAKAEQARHEARADALAEENAGLKAQVAKLETERECWPTQCRPVPETVAEPNPFPGDVIGESEHAWTNRFGQRCLVTEDPIAAALERADVLFRADSTLGRETLCLAGELRQVRAESHDIQAKYGAAFEDGYAQAEADIRALIERRERGARDVAARSGDAQYNIWHARAAGLSALLVDIGHSLHRAPAWTGADSAEPEMMDTPDGPSPYPGGGDVDQGFVDAFRVLRTWAAEAAGGDVFGGATDLGAVVADDAYRNAPSFSERAAGAFEPGDLGDSALTQLQEHAHLLHQRCATLEERVFALEAKTSVRPAIDLAPLLRLAEIARRVERTEPNAENLSVPSGRVLRALREAGVIPQDSPSP